MIQHGAVTIVYDGDGNRVSETVGGVTTNYLVDTQNPTGYAQVVDELQNGTVTRTYSYGLERINENQLAAGNWQLSFYSYDGHGSVRQLTNAAGAVTDTYDFDAFGNLTNQTGSTPNNYLFAGEQYDAALGLYYNHARYYNQQIGRFWSMDSHEGNPMSPLFLHKYLYSRNNPIDRFDPSGNDDIATLVTVAAIDIGLAAYDVYNYYDTYNKIAHEYVKLPPDKDAALEQSLEALIADLDAAHCAQCENAVFGKLGITIDEYENHLKIGHQFWDGTKSRVDLINTL